MKLLMSPSHTFRVIIEDDQFEDGRPAYHAYCPALPGCHTWGYTHEEAESNIREAISLYLEDALEAGEEAPTDSSIQPVGNESPSVMVTV